MGIRFESNYQRFAGAAPTLLNDNDPLVRWYRIHEWQVDPGFTGKLLMVMLNVEPQFPIPGTVDYGWMRLQATLDPGETKWVTRWEGKFKGAALTGKMFTPRLTILPMGSGITLTEGQGLMTQAFATIAVSYRWWSCYVIDAGVA